MPPEEAGAAEAPAEVAPEEAAPEAAPEAAAPASEEKANSININAFSIAFGTYGGNYERLFANSHGLMVEGYFSSSSDGDTSATGGGGALGYRWHWSGKQNSGFLGAVAGFGMGSGDAVVDVNGARSTFTVNTTTIYAAANIGYRWAWDFGLNITLRGGGGYANYGVSTDSEDANAEKAVELVDDLLSWIPVYIDGELSIGFNF
ncbi:MAG: hypothetical protein AUK47_10755 [Deltaproteobacteria bacterium CG2_30_63_29]|nr:MAG: hypothetical protein AUK47_10755 [Deltaproteobacteria bacterium CG2_30_63_29]